MLVLIVTSSKSLMILVLVHTVTQEGSIWCIGSIVLRYDQVYILITREVYLHAMVVVFIHLKTFDANDNVTVNLFIVITHHIFHKLQLSVLT